MSDGTPREGPSRERRPRRKKKAVRWPRRLLWVLTTIAVGFILGLLWLHSYRNDDALARFIMDMNNPNIRGRLEFGSIHWDTQAIVDMAVGVPSKVQVQHFALYDPSGKRIIYAPRATGLIELYPLLLGGGHLLVHKLTPHRATCLVHEMRGPRFRVGLLEAFKPTKPGDGRRGPRIELRDFVLRGARVKLEFAAWSLSLDDVNSNGSFLHGGGSPAKEGLIIDHHTRVKTGVLKVGEIKLPLRDVVVNKLGGLPEAPTRMDVDLKGTLGGSPVKISGRLEDVYRGEASVKLDVVAGDAQRLVTRVVGEGSAVGGRARVTGSLRGAVSRPRITGRVSGLDLGAEPTRLRDLSGQVVLDLPEDRLEVEDVRGRLMGGTIRGSAKMDLNAGDWDGAVDVSGVDPGSLHPLLAGKLTGSIGLKGGVRPVSRGLAVLKVQLQRRRRDLLPRKLDLDGSVHLGKEIVDLAGLNLRGDGNTITTRGSVNLKLKQVNLYLRAGLPNLGGWLAHRGIPRAVTSAHGNVHVTGRFPLLRATGTVTARGVGHGPVRVKEVKGDLAFAGGVLELKRLRAKGYGGRLEGNATMEIFRGSLLRPRPMPLLRARVKAAGIDLTALGLSPHVIGRVFGEANISGPLDGLSGTATLRVPRATVQGDPYVQNRIRIGILKDRISVYEGKIRRASGGEIALWGDVHHKGGVDLRLQVSRFPVTAIPSLGHLPLGLAGRINGRVDMTGSLARPRLSGAVDLSGAKVRGVSLGSGRLTLTPGSDAVRLQGRFFGDLLALEGYLLTDPHPRMHLTLSLTKLPIEKLLYEVRELGDVRGLLDGRVRLDLDSEKGLAWADARFTRAQLQLRYRSPGSRKVQKVVITNDQDLLARWDGRQLHLVTARLVSNVPGKARRAEFNLGGWLSAERADMRLRGKVAVELLEFFLARRVKKLEGDATADVRLTGSVDQPKLEGGFWLHGVKLWMPKFDRVIDVPHGHIRLVPGSLQLSSLKVRVGRYVASASGKVGLSRFRPTMLDLSVGGDLNFKLLELLFPERISSASGAARVKLRITGPVQDPQFSGQLAVSQVEIAPRGWGRTITLRRGSVAMTNYLVKTITPLEGTYDEGVLRVQGSVRLDRWDLANIDLRITGLGIPQRQPRVYSAELNFNLQLLGDSNALELHGNADLVDVRYVRKFDLIRKAFIKPRVYEEEDPFWKGMPLLENLALQLTVRSSGQMRVKNEYAQLSLSGAFRVEGTLAQPRIGGQVRVEEGTFTIPFLRGQYTISRGDILFNKRRPVDQAELSITGETLFMDHTGVDYQIKLTLEGPLNRIGIKMTSNPPLEQGQIWALLVTGRTTEQLRDQLKGAVDTGGGNQAAGAADAQVKQLTGEILNQIMVDPLKKVTKLDLLRFEMGTESAQVKAGKRLGRYINLAGEAEVGLLGDSRAEGRLEFKMHDLLMLVGKLERLSTRLETEDVDPSRGRIELKVRLPLR